MLGIEDQIYEAAFVPEIWPTVLGRIAETADTASGAMLIVDRQKTPMFSSTPNIAETLEAFSRTSHWYTNPPLMRLRRRRYAGFLEVSDFLEADVAAGDAFHTDNMRRIGAAWQVGSVVDMPDGGLVAFTFERAQGKSNFSSRELAYFDVLRPHLARAGMMGMRLNLQRAEASVAAMQALSIPAAIVGRGGAVIAVNDLFETLSAIIRPSAFGRLSLANREASKLLQEALSETSAQAMPIRSIPVAGPERQNLVLHVLPLRRSASDMLSHGSALLTVTGYSAGANVPPDAVLRGLFDLSAAEAGVAAGLASGLSLADIAAGRRITIATARTHLAQIFRKTCTNQQAQLVALLKGVTGNIG